MSKQWYCAKEYENAPCAALFEITKLTSQAMWWGVDCQEGWSWTKKSLWESLGN